MQRTSQDLQRSAAPTDLAQAPAKQAVVADGVNTQVANANWDTGDEKPALVIQMSDVPKSTEDEPDASSSGAEKMTTRDMPAKSRDYCAVAYHALYRGITGTVLYAGATAVTIYYTVDSVKTSLAYQSSNPEAAAQFTGAAIGTGLAAAAFLTCGVCWTVKCLVPEAKFWIGVENRHG